MERIRLIEEWQEADAEATKATDAFLVAWQSHSHEGSPPSDLTFAAEEAERLRRVAREKFDKLLEHLGAASTSDP